jgi:hypothetical protein
VDCGGAGRQIILLRTAMKDLLVRAREAGQDIRASSTCCVSAYWRIFARAAALARPHYLCLISACLPYTMYACRFPFALLFARNSCGGALTLSPPLLFYLYRMTSSLWRGCLQASCAAAIRILPVLAACCVSLGWR